MAKYSLIKGKSTSKTRKSWKFDSQEDLWRTKLERRIRILENLLPYILRIRQHLPLDPPPFISVNENSPDFILTLLSILYQLIDCLGSRGSTFLEMAVET